MPYRPSHGLLFRPAGSVFGAIPFASFGAAVAGTFLSLLLMFFEEIGRSIEKGLFTETAPDILNQNLSTAVFAVPLGIFVGTFLLAGYLLVFGAPTALLLRDRLDTHWGFAASIGTALLASSVAFAAIWGDVGRLPELPWHAPALILAFALPAALFYHRGVILLLEEPG